MPHQGPHPTDNDQDKPPLLLDLHFSQVRDRYRVEVLESPDDSGQAEYFDLPITSDELNDLVDKVDGRDIRKPKLLNELFRELETVGAALFDAVFTGEVGSCYRSSKSAAKLQNTYLQIRLRLANIGPLLTLPWECLFDTHIQSSLCSSGEVSIIRYSQSSSSHLNAFPRGAPLRMLIVAPQAGKETKLDVENEIMRIEDALAQPLASHLLTITHAKPDITSLDEALSGQNYHILHFIGHGYFDGGGALIFEDIDGERRDVDAVKLGQLLTGHRSVQLVVLNSCLGARTDASDPLGGMANLLVRQGVPSVIAMQFSIQDESAVIFAKTFYSKLASGTSVDMSVNLARKAITLSDTWETDFATPVVYTREHEALFATPRHPYREAALVGVRISRGAVECGAVITPAGVTSFPSVADCRSLNPVQYPVKNATEWLEQVASAIRTTVYSPEIPPFIEGIGIGLPGLINPINKNIERSVKGLPDGFDLVGRLARLLADEKFLTRTGWSAGDLNTHIRIDNDVRCATRLLLSEHTHGDRAEKDWRNFAAIHLGTGVSTGLVQGGRLQYGEKGWAGELGHVDLRIPTGDDYDKRFWCDGCDSPGLHYESLVNYAGLKVLAGRISEGKFHAIDAALVASKHGEEDDKSWWPALIGSMGESEKIPEAVRGLVSRDDYREFLQEVLKRYVSFVAAGAACVARLFDVRRVVFFGSLCDTLSETGHFKGELDSAVGNRIELQRQVCSVHRNDDGPVWRGAALLMRDPKVRA